MVAFLFGKDQWMLATAFSGRSQIRTILASICQSSRDNLFCHLAIQEETRSSVNNGLREDPARWTCAGLVVRVATPVTGDSAKPAAKKADKNKSTAVARILRISAEQGKLEYTLVQGDVATFCCGEVILPV